MSGGVPWDAVARLGQFAGLRSEGDRIFKSEANEDPDFSGLPAEVREALVTIGRLAPDEPVHLAPNDRQPVAKAEVPHTKADGDAAKAAAGTAVKERKLRPGEGRKMASDVIAEDVKRIRKEHPNWSEAKTWSWALENDQHAIDTYTRGEIAEAQSRTKA